MIQHLDHFNNLLVLILILDKWTHKAAILKTQIFFLIFSTEALLKPLMINLRELSYKTLNTSNLF